MIKSLIVFIKLFFLLELTFIIMGGVIWGFFDLISYIKDGEIHLDRLYRLLKGLSLGCIFASLVFWIVYYLWPKFKNRNTF